MRFGEADVKRLFAIASASFVTLVSSLAFACPVCAQRDEEGVMRYVALGALVFLPWLVVGAGAAFILRERSALEAADELSVASSKAASSKEGSRETER